jgi:hypothetical protein
MSTPVITIPRHRLERGEYVRLMTNMTLRRLLIVLPIWCIILVFLIYGNPKSGMVMAVGSMFAAIAGSITMYIFLRAFFTVRTRDPEIQQLFTERELVVRQDALEVKSGGKTQHFSWKKMDRASKDSGLILLHLSPTSQFVVPMRAFGKAEDRHHAEALLREHGLLR